ncbi:hypothetical protein BscR1v2_014440 [Bartonella schoenbuchensis R1]|uniref:Uncharacterized protein n=1 Tax=Bartonella schoenbuchensis (strain DSM 13525 / NCTC 13165 / R1) TaxID=687861 RepID=A0A1S6XRW9_BARSR|nr:hypothetical protein [Bartonella schoenbuchensis]AQX31349.1 hypothetical protein BscR1v2_014440 [Bartonella schoenbuchensis R1]
MGVSQKGGRGDEVFTLRSKGEGGGGVEQGDEAAGAQCGVEAVGVSQKGGGVIIIIHGRKWV